jgi:AcrR family transcriptional regulator
MKGVPSSSPSQPRVRVTQAQRRAVTRAKITAAGLEALAERGYGEMTFAGVALRAGVSRGALLHYFPSKVELALAIIEDGAVVLLRELRDHVEATRDASDADTRMFDGIFAGFAGNLFQAFLALQVHARNDVRLNQRLTGTADRAVRAYGEIALEVWGAELARHPDWNSFIWLVNDTVRGITLSTDVDRFDPNNPVWVMARELLVDKLGQLRVSHAASDAGAR